MLLICLVLLAMRGSASALCSIEDQLGGCLACGEILGGFGCPLLPGGMPLMLRVWVDQLSTHFQSLMDIWFTHAPTFLGT